MPTPATHIWKPSVARSVTIDSFVPVPRGTSATIPALLSWPTKDPGDILDYVLDISPAIIGNDGDSISTLDILVNPSNAGDLIVQNTTTDGSRIVVWLAGGFAGTVYTVTFSLTTTNGRSLTRSVMLPVLALATVDVPADALLTTSGSALTDQNGNPIILGS